MGNNSCVRADDVVHFVKAACVSRMASCIRSRGQNRCITCHLMPAFFKAKLSSRGRCCCRACSCASQSAFHQSGLARSPTCVHSSNIDHSRSDTGTTTSLTPHDASCESSAKHTVVALLRVACSLSFNPSTCPTRPDRVSSTAQGPRPMPPIARRA